MPKPTLRNAVFTFVSALGLTLGGVAHASFGAADEPEPRDQAGTTEQGTLHGDQAGGMQQEGTFQEDQAAATGTDDTTSPWDEDDDEDDNTGSF